DGGDEPAPLRPRVRRGTDAARASGAYGDAVAEARGEVIVVHLRRASVGLALTPENTHPFVEGEVTFSHNGQFDLSDQLRARILARGGRTPAGTTDSELFLSLITAWAAQLPPREGRGDWALAVQHAAAELTALTAELFGRPPAPRPVGPRLPPTSRSRCTPPGGGPRPTGCWSPRPATRSPASPPSPRARRSPCTAARCASRSTRRCRCQEHLGRLSTSSSLER